MKGSVYRAENGSWRYRFDLEPDSLTGRRRLATKRGFRTEKEAARATREAMRAHEQGRRVRPARRTVEVFLNEWHDAIRPGLRPTTWVNYRDYSARGHRSQSAGRTSEVPKVPASHRPPSSLRLDVHTRLLGEPPGGR